MKQKKKAGLTMVELLCALAVLWDAFPAVESAPRIHRLHGGGRIAGGPQL